MSIFSHKSSRTAEKQIIATVDEENIVNEEQQLAQQTTPAPAPVQEKPVETPVVQEPTEEIVEEQVEETTEEVVEETPVEESVEEVEEQQEETAEEQVEETTEEVVEETPAEEPVEVVEETPVEEPVEEVEEQQEEVAEESAEDLVLDIPEVEETQQETAEEIVAIVPDVVEEVAEEPTAEEVSKEPVYQPTFAEKMNIADEDIQRRYDELKNYALRFKKLTWRISKKYDSINMGRFQFVKLSVAGKTLKLNLNMDIAEADPKFHCVDKSKTKTYEEVPCQMRIKSDRGLKYAKELIDQCAEKHGLVENPKFKPVNSLELIERHLELGDTDDIIIEVQEDDEE